MLEEKMIANYSEMEYGIGVTEHDTSGYYEIIVAGIYEVWPPVDWDKKWVIKRLDRFNLELSEVKIFLRITIENILSLKFKFQ